MRALSGDTHVQVTLLSCSVFTMHWYVQDGLMPMHSAAFNGHNSVVTALLEAGANLNSADKVWQACIL